MKRFDFKSMFIGIITGSLLFGGIVGANTLITGKIYLSTHSINVDGKAYKPENALLNYEGTTYVPLREFSTITGSTVNFKDGTITIKKPATTSTNTSTNTGSTNTSTTTSLNGKKLTIEAGDTDSFYVDLKAANAKSATIAVTSGTAYAKVSKTSLTASGLITVTGQKQGSAIIKVTYSTGLSDVINVSVTGKTSSSAPDEIEIELAKNSQFVYYIDLDDYDADEADIYVDDDDSCLEVTLGSSKITSSKTTTSSKALTIKGKATGSGEVEIEFDSGDILTIYVDVVSKSNFDFDYYYDESEDDLIIDEGDWDSIELDPDDYDADWATISVIGGYNYITVSDTRIDEETEVDIDGYATGEAVIQVTYNTGDIEYYYIEVVD